MSVTELRRTPLAKWMFKNGVSGRELAALVGTSEPTISRLKTGAEIQVSDDTRRRLLEITGLKRL